MHRHFIHRCPRAGGKYIWMPGILLEHDHRDVERLVVLKQADRAIVDNAVVVDRAPTAQLLPREPGVRPTLVAARCRRMLQALAHRAVLDHKAVPHWRLPRTGASGRRAQRPAWPCLPPETSRQVGGLNALRTPRSTVLLAPPPTRRTPRRQADRCAGELGCPLIWVRRWSLEAQPRLRLATCATVLPAMLARTVAKVPPKEPLPSHDTANQLHHSTHEIRTREPVMNTVTILVASKAMATPSS